MTDSLTEKAPLKILKWENHIQLVRWNSTIKLLKQVQ